MRLERPLLTGEGRRGAKVGEVLRGAAQVRRRVPRRPVVPGRAGGARAAHTCGALRLRPLTQGRERSRRLPSRVAARPAGSVAQDSGASGWGPRARRHRPRDPGAPDGTRLRSRPRRGKKADGAGDHPPTVPGSKRGTANPGRESSPRRGSPAGGPRPRPTCRLARAAREGGQGTLGPARLRLDPARRRNPPLPAALVRRGARSPGAQPPQGATREVGPGSLRPLPVGAAPFPVHRRPRRDT